MDTSKEYEKFCRNRAKSPIEDIEYILMCEKAVEVQKIWCDERELEKEDFTAWIKEKDGMPISKYVIWLPRQDQLQGMVVGIRKPTHLIQDFNNIMDTWFEFGYTTNPELDEKLTMVDWSMEQLWLAFVMLEKFNKIWNGKDWEKK